MNQTYHPIEVIVVDNYSTDKTREIATKFGVKVYLKGPERATQMNFGRTIAKGEYFYRVDSDFILDPSLVEEAVAKCEEGFDAIAVHNTSDPLVSFWSKVRKLERDCYRDDDLNIGARFFKMEVFDAVGGFDEKLIAAEDYDLHNKIVKMGYKIGRITRQEIHIGEPKNLSEIVRKSYYYGTTIQNYIQKNPEISKKQLSPIRISYFKHISHFMENPILAVGFIFYQSVRYFSTLIGILTVRFKK
jgi:glycosyltransferase involved in cell wall biosynthesis